MKRTGGGYVYSYNAHTAVDETAQIVVAAQISNNAADNDRLPVLLAAMTPSRCWQMPMGQYSGPRGQPGP